MDIERHHRDPRMSQIVSHGGLVYLSGQVADQAPDASVGRQTAAICERIDELLVEAGSDKSRLLTATIWLSSMAYYDEMNAVWNDWLPDDTAPARACVEARLARPCFDVEIMVTAAKKVS